MRDAVNDTIFELAKEDPRIAYICSDLHPPLLKRLQEEMPGRGFMEGVSEQYCVGMAAGMAAEGFIPFFHTIAVFATRRCYDQIACDVCIPDLPVRIIGAGGGLVYAPLGPTHIAIDDIALMRALPNMTVLCPGDKNEARELLKLYHDHWLLVR